MTAVQGIEIENNSNGRPQFVRIDLDTYGEKLAPFLLEIGILPAKDDFDLAWEKAISIDEAKEISINKIRNWWGK
jgi:hypothetical protein